MTDEQRRRGLELMRTVYGWDIEEPAGQDPSDFLNLTVVHLFGTVWDRGDFTLRERRLLLIGLLVGQGLDDVVELQCDAALRVGDLSADDLRALVIFLAHYAGWPRAAKLNSAVEGLIARQTDQ